MPQDREKDDVLGGLVELRWMASALVTRKFHGPRYRRRSAHKLAVHEVAQAYERRAERAGNDREVREVVEPDASPPAEPCRDEDAADSAPMACQAAFPDRDNLYGIGEIVRRLINKH